MVEALTGWMEDRLEDFREERQRCDAAAASLAQELGDAVAAELGAIRRQVASGLRFSAFLGFRDNLRHFADPIARTFLEADFETYLREGTARQLPEYVAARAERERFYALLSPAQREFYEDIAAYAGYLETLGPKLAHYYGYLLGDELLPQVMPGYVPDRKLNAKYRRMLEDYCGADLG